MKRKTKELRRHGEEAMENLVWGKEWTPAAYSNRAY